MRVHHIALRSTDADRLERFYGGTLGLPVVRRDASRGSVWLGAEGAVVMLEAAGAEEPAVPPGSMDLVAFAVEDKEAWRHRLRQAGVTLEAETEHTLYFRDPDGRRVAVSTYPIPA